MSSPFTEPWHGHGGGLSYWLMETVQVKERPILFSGAMVRALLAGSKTQTRRAVKDQPTTGKWLGLVKDGPAYAIGKHLFRTEDEALGTLDEFVKCPYGQPGERLWVRESARYTGTSHYGLSGERKVMVRYNADDAGEWFPATEAEYDYVLNKMHPPIASGKKENPAIPSIHLKRKYSRLLLEITAVRCERLQRINSGDAVAEGIELIKFPGWVGDTSWKNYLTDESHCPHPVDSYSTLWQKINGPESWAANPWVWVVEFKVVAA